MAILPGPPAAKGEGRGQNDDRQDGQKERSGDHLPTFYKKLFKKVGRPKPVDLIVAI